jgi:hypothetical protein
VALSAACNPEPRFENSAAALTANLAVIVALIRKGKQVRQAADFDFNVPAPIGTANG